MRKIFLAIIVLALTACGNKASRSAADADSTQVHKGDSANLETASDRGQNTAAFGFDFERYRQGVLDEVTDWFMIDPEEKGLKDYALVDVDGDGKPELWVRGDEEQNTQGIYAIVGDSVSILAGIDGLGDFMFYRHAVGYSRYQSGQYRNGFTFLDDSKPGDSYDSEEQSNPYSEEHELQGAVYYKNGDEISEEVFKKAEELLGEKCPEPANLVWHSIE